jgi:hypothetical protein
MSGYDISTQAFIRSINRTVKAILIKAETVKGNNVINGFNSLTFCLYARP